MTEREREREIKERELSPRSVYLSETEQSLSCSTSVRIGARDGLTWLLRLKMSNACARSCVCVCLCLCTCEFRTGVTQCPGDEFMCQLTLMLSEWRKPFERASPADARTDFWKLYFYFSVLSPMEAAVQPETDILPIF